MSGEAPSLEESLDELVREFSVQLRWWFDEARDLPYDLKDQNNGLGEEAIREAIKKAVHACLLELEDMECIDVPRD